LEESKVEFRGSLENLLRTERMPEDRSDRDRIQFGKGVVEFEEHRRGGKK
jgi:hypothetical protein